MNWFPEKEKEALNEKESRRAGKEWHTKCFKYTMGKGLEASHSTYAPVE